MLELENVNFKKLHRKDVKILVDWAEAEGWNPGKDDFNVFWKTDPDGFYGCYFNDTLIAGGAIISYHATYGFMGLFIVHPKYRGIGIGKKLWHFRKNFLLQRLKKGSAIGMDGVVEMQPFYEKGGFTIAFRDERYECVGQNALISNCISVTEFNDFEKLLNYDIECFGFKRLNFLKNWLTIPNSKSFKYMENNSLKGYAVIRKVKLGYKIGPLFADNPDIAEALFKACLDSAVGKLIYIDIPVINKEAMNLVRKYNARYVFECARMYYGEKPKTAIDKVYGITTFELG